MARKYGKKASEKIERTMREWKRGTLKTSAGRKVTSREQAIAIGLSQARRAGGKVPPPPRYHATMSADKKGITAKALDSIQVLWRQPDTMALYGIPYEMRPGQSPHNIQEKFRGDWIWLGSPGWWGSLSRPEQERVRAFLAKQPDLPEWPNEWIRVSATMKRSHATRRKYPYVAYWVHSRGLGGRQSEPVYVLGTTTRPDEGIVGHDLRVRPLRLGKGSYTTVVSPDDVEGKP